MGCHEQDGSQGEPLTSPQLGSVHPGTRAARASLGIFSFGSTEIELRGSKEKGQILHRPLAKETKGQE